MSNKNWEVDRKQTSKMRRAKEIEELRKSTRPIFDEEWDEEEEDEDDE